MTTVDLDALVEAVEFVSAGTLTGHRAYVSVDTGAIYWVSDTGDCDDDAPADLEESDRYLASVRRFFAGPGAYGRFKDLLEARGQLEAWYTFEAGCTERALVEWCEERELQATQKSG